MAAKHSDNKFVKYAKENGFCNVILLSADIDPKHEEWMKTYHNKFHGGSEVTFDEVVNDALELRSMWCAHAYDSGLIERSRDQEEDGYLSKMWNFLKDQPKASHFEGHNNKFLKAGRLGDKLVKLKVKDSVSEMLGEYCDYLNKDFHIHAVIGNMHDVVKIIMLRLVAQ
eukprot:9326515-Pyramimonas_sp.AAC.1